MAYGASRAITIDHTKLSGTTDVVVLFSGIYPWLKSVLNGGTVNSSSGFDIIFTADISGITQLDHEIIPNTYDPVTGAFGAWVRVPSVSSSVDTIIYCLYGNGLISTSQENITGVWGANATSVMHLEDGVTLSLVDSSTAGNNGTNINTVTAIAGKVYGGADFTANNQNIIAPGGPSGDGARTIEFWVNTSGTGLKVLYDQWNTTTNLHRFLIYFAASTTHITVDVNGMSCAATTNIRDSAWHHVAVVYPGSGFGNLKIYVDGTAESLSFTFGIFGSSTALITDSSAGQFGAPTDGPVSFIGQMDEPRIYSLAQSAVTEKGTYNTQFNPSTFYSVGAEVIQVNELRVVVAPDVSFTGTMGHIGQLVVIVGPEVSFTAEPSIRNELIVECSPDVSFTGFQGLIGELVVECQPEVSFTGWQGHVGELIVEVSPIVIFTADLAGIHGECIVAPDTAGPLPPVRDQNHTY